MQADPIDAGSNGIKPIHPGLGSILVNRVDGVGEENYAEKTWAQLGLNFAPLSVLWVLYRLGNLQKEPLFIRIEHFAGPSRLA